MKIGITGGKGFIGSHLAGKFKKENHQVLIFDFPDNDLLAPKEENLKKFVRDSQVIIHAAGINHGSNTEIVAGNLVATYNLISAMSRYHSRAKLIFISSIQAETNTVFGKSKELTEIMLRDFSRQTKNQVTVFRTINVFGPACQPFYNSVVATFCYQTAKNQELLVNHPGKKINFIFIKDLVKIIQDEIWKNRGANFYFKRISSVHWITIGKLAKLIKSFGRRGNPKKLRSKLEKDLFQTYLSYNIKDKKHE